MLPRLLGVRDSVKTPPQSDCDQRTKWVVTFTTSFDQVRGMTYHNKGTCSIHKPCRAQGSYIPLPFTC